MEELSELQKTIHSKGIEKGLSKNKEGRKVSKQKGNSTSFKKMWIDAVHEYFPDHPITGKVYDFKNLHTFAKELNDPEDFINWIARDWMHLMMGEFSWMDNKPEFPELGFVVRMNEKFINQYMTRKKHSAANLFNHDKDLSAEIKILRKKIILLEQENTQLRSLLAQKTKLKPKDTKNLLALKEERDNINNLLTINGKKRFKDFGAYEE